MNLGGGGEEEYDGVNLGGDGEEEYDGVNLGGDGDCGGGKLGGAVVGCDAYSCIAEDSLVRVCDWPSFHFFHCLSPRYL